MRQSDITKLETGLMQKTSGILRLSIALDVPGPWLELGDGEEPTWTADVKRNSSHPAKRAVDQSMSQYGPTVARRITILTWDEVMASGELPAFFSTTAPDDAMAPRASAGQEVAFATGIDPRPGAGVLIEDRHGQRHLRLYVQGSRPGHWIARAENPAYRSFDSEADGLKVLAVLRGVMKGWEE
jgi:hypothetical protein